MRTTRLRPVIALAVAAIALAGLVGTHPGAAAGAADDPSRLVVTVAGWLIWVIAAYLAGVTALAALLTLLAGPRPQAARITRLTPSWFRAALAVALGAGMTAPTLAIVPAVAATRPVVHRHGPAHISVSWPTSTTPRGHATAAPATPARSPARITVRPGECLWSIAAEALPPRASDARVAAAWPRWWRTNRSVVGPDPDLIRPGERLTQPPARSTT
jgi:hypothetical protein